MKPSRNEQDNEAPVPPCRAVLAGRPSQLSGRVARRGGAGHGGFWQLSARVRVGRMGCDALMPGLGDFEYVLTVVGLLGVIKFLAQLLWSIGDGVRTHFWSRLWKKRLVEDYGKWAGELESPSKWKVSLMTGDSLLGLGGMPCCRARPARHSEARARLLTGHRISRNNCVLLQFLVPVTFFVAPGHFPSCGAFASCNPWQPWLLYFISRTISW